MFFPASKILWFLVTPSTLLFLLLLMSFVVMYTRFWKAGRKFAFFVCVLLLVFGILPSGTLLLLPLEHRFPELKQASLSPSGIIVLGGASETEITAAHQTLALNEAAERMTEGAALARRFPRAKLVFAGGDGGLLGGRGVEADDALNLFVTLGVPSSQILLENSSRNTFENARNLEHMITPKQGEQWLLVTSAAHMPRAMGCFRKAGLNVTAYPVDYRTRDGAENLWPAGSFSEGLRRFDNAAREWIGLIVYKQLGYTDSLFPAP